ncbi:MAG: type II toxin-antitoxin system RelE/ParE family toxin [Planctomycetes bacterium]|nr:type II toxin-antitoxin system RelE/ParE family toxin [Planctomycetota bacterium]
MAKYKITIKNSAAKELAEIPKKDLPKIVKHIQSLAQNPRPHGSQKLSRKEEYRVRQGNYRIVYSVDDKVLTVDVVQIGHRREVYRP